MVAHINKIIIISGINPNNIFIEYLLVKYDTGSLARHIAKDESRFKYAGLIAETIENPQRISVDFIKSRKTGKVAIRQYFYKKFMDKDEGERLVKVVFDGGMVKEIDAPAFRIWTAFQHWDTEGAVIYERL